MQEFVDELVQLAANAVQLTDAATALAVQCNGNGSRAKDDIHQMVDQGEELKASAPTFVPRQLLSPAVAEFHPTTTRLEAGSVRDVQTMSLSLSPIGASTTRLQSRKVDEKTGVDDGEQVNDEQDGDDDAMQNEDSFFWSVAYEVETKHVLLLDVALFAFLTWETLGPGCNCCGACKPSGWISSAKFVVCFSVC